MNKKKTNMEKFKIVIKGHNYETGEKIYMKSISEKKIAYFKPLIKFIKGNINHTTWNWWKHLPDSWDSCTSRYHFNKYAFHLELKDRFGAEFTNDAMFEEFFDTFTPFGCDRIEDIKIYEMKDVTDELI